MEKWVLKRDDGELYWAIKHDRTHWGSIMGAVVFLDSTESTGDWSSLVDAASFVPFRVATKDEKADVYESFVRMAKKLGATFGHHTSEIDEMVEEALAELGLVVAGGCDGFDARKSHLATWIYHKLYWHLHRLQSAAAKNKIQSLPPVLESPQNDLDSRRGEFSDKAQELLRILQYDPCHILNGLKIEHGPFLLQEYLVTTHGWTWDEVDQVWDEFMKECTNECETNYKSR